MANAKVKVKANANSLKKAKEKPFALNVGRRLRALRETLALSQPALSKITGFSKSLISNWERGDRPPSIQQLINLCKAMNLHPYDFCPELYEFDIDLQHKLQDKQKTIFELRENIRTIHNLTKTFL